MIDLTKPLAAERHLVTLRVPVLYKGFRFADRVLVKADGRTLTPGPSQKIWNHSPDGFNWGYGGSGPAQLALALLLDTALDPDICVRLHQDFKRTFVAKWVSEHNWALRGVDLLEWLDAALGDLRDRGFGKGEEDLPDE